MSPDKPKLRGFLSEARNQFRPIRVKHKKKWVTKFHCVYPHCAKRKSIHGEQLPRMETTYTQVYVHAMRFQRAGLYAENIFSFDPRRDGSIDEKLENESRLAPAGDSNKSEVLQALTDWTVLM